MPQPSKSSGVIAVRSKQLLLAPPGVLGFHNLLKPDMDAAERFNASPKFNCRIAYNEEQAEILGRRVDQAVEANWGELLKALEEAKKAPPRKGGEWVKPSGADWVAEHLTEPSEKSRVQLPTLQWANEADFRKKDGGTARKTMRAYDAKGGQLDLPSLCLGMGSIVQAVLVPGLYVSPLLNGGQPAPSFKLQGVRVIKLERYGAGGGSSSLGDVSDEDMDALGDIEVDDLGSYAAKEAAPEASHQEERPTRERTSVDDFSDDEIPF